MHIDLEIIIQATRLSNIVEDGIVQIIEISEEEKNAIIAEYLAKQKAEQSGDGADADKNGNDT